MNVTKMAEIIKLEYMRLIKKSEPFNKIFFCKSCKRIRLHGYKTINYKMFYSREGGKIKEIIECDKCYKNRKLIEAL